MTETEFNPNSKHWSRIVNEGSSDEGVFAIIKAINRATKSKRAGQADVIVACAQVLAQSIAGADPEIAADIRLAVLAMIEGYTYQVAVASEGGEG